MIPFYSLDVAPLYRRPSIVDIHPHHLETADSSSRETAINAVQGTNHLCPCLHRLRVDLLPAFRFQLLHLEKQKKTGSGVHVCVMVKFVVTVEMSFKVCMADQVWRDGRRPRLPGTYYCVEYIYTSFIYRTTTA